MYALCCVAKVAGRGVVARSSLPELYLLGTRLMVNCACWVPAGHLLLFRSSRHVSDPCCPQRDCFESSWEQARRQDTYADAVEVGSLVSSQKLKLAVRDSPRIIRVRQEWFGPDETTSTAQRAPTSDLAS